MGDGEMDYGGSVDLLARLMRSDRLSEDERRILNLILETYWKRQWNLRLEQLNEDLAAIVYAILTLPSPSMAIVETTVKNAFESTYGIPKPTPEVGEEKHDWWQAWKSGIGERIPPDPIMAMVRFLYEEEKYETETGRSSSVQKIEASITPINRKKTRAKAHAPKLVPVRLLVEAAAGSPISSERQPDDVMVPERIVDEVQRKDEPAVAVRARGDSMRPTILDGETLLCRAVFESFNYKTGQVVVALIPDGDLCRLSVKRFGGTSKGITRLISDNELHEPILIPREQCRIDAVVEYRNVGTRWKKVPAR